MRGLNPNLARRLAGLLALVVLLAGCAAAGGDRRAARAQWLQAAALDARDTPDALYAAALAEGGSLTVYTSTTRAMETKRSFEQQYPGLVVEMQDIRTTQLVDALLRAAEEGGTGCDVVVCSNRSPDFLNKLLPSGLVAKYLPWDMADAMLYPDEPGYLPCMIEAEIVCWNGAAFDEPPFANLWELCEPRFAGQVYCANPLVGSSTHALFLALMDMDEPLRSAYERLYGQPLALPAGESAGREYLRRLLANGLMVTNSSDEVAEAVGSPGQTAPRVGFMVSSKLRLNEVGYNLRPQYALDPVPGILVGNSVMMVTDSEKVNTAKLFIRWLLGEADGTGEGYKPFLRAGSWPARADVEAPHNPPLADIGFLVPEAGLPPDKQQAFQAFWVEASAGAPPGGAGEAG